MIDYFAIGLTHGLLALAAWRLLMREDLDGENAGNNGSGSNKVRKSWRKGQNGAEGGAGDA